MEAAAARRPGIAPHNNNHIYRPPSDTVDYALVLSVRGGGMPWDVGLGEGTGRSSAETLGCYALH